MGEIFVEVTKDEAEQLLENATTKLSEVHRRPEALPTRLLHVVLLGYRKSIRFRNRWRPSRRRWPSSR
jgi:hypothetical protein